MMLREVKARLRSRNNQQGKEETGKEETKDPARSFLSFALIRASCQPGKQKQLHPFYRKGND